MQAYSAISAVNNQKTGLKTARNRLPIKLQTVKIKYNIILCTAMVTAFQTTGHIKFKRRQTACCASILTYCATHTLPYLCTPTSVSCLSLEPFSTVPQRAEKVLFGTLIPPCGEFHRAAFL